MGFLGSGLGKDFDQFARRGKNAGFREHSPGYWGDGHLSLDSQGKRKKILDFLRSDRRPTIEANSQIEEKNVGFREHSSAYWGGGHFYFEFNLN